MKKNNTYFTLLCIGMHIITHGQINLKINPIDTTSYEICINFDIEDYDALYADYCSIALDNQNIELSEPQCSVEPTQLYDPSFKQTKKMLVGPCSFTIHLTSSMLHDVERAHLYVSYHLKSSKHSNTVSFNLKDYVAPEDTTEIAQSVETEAHIYQKQESPELTKINPRQTSPQHRVWNKLRAFIYSPWFLIPGIIILFILIGFIVWRLPLICTGLLISGILLSYCCALHLPLALSLALLALGALLLGLAMLYKTTHAKHLHWRSFFASLGMALLACSLVIASKAYQAHYQRKSLQLIQILK